MAGANARDPIITLSGPPRRLRQTKLYNAVPEGDQMAKDVIESRGICHVCQRFMTNRQELTTLDGKTIHVACMPGVVKVGKKPNSYS